MSRRRTALWVVAIIGFVDVGRARAQTTATPAIVSVGDVALNGSNTGTTMISVETFPTQANVVPDGMLCSEFRVTKPTQPFTVGSGVDPAAVTIEFTPRSPGAKRCTFDVTLGDAVAGSFQVTGTGVEPLISVPQLTLNFGDVDVGATSGAMPIVATNTGSAPLHITSAGFTEDSGAGFAFSEIPSTTHPAGADVLARDNVRYNITCTPSAPRTYTGTFEIDSNAFGVATVDVVLTCNGVQGQPGETPPPTLPDVRGGGCAAGGTTGGAAIAIVLLVLRRRRMRSIASTAVAIALCLIATARSARADDIVVGVFDPTPSTASAGFQLESPEVGAAGAWAARIVASYATDLLVVDSVDGVADHAIKRRSTLDVGGAYAFLGRFEIGLQLPIDSQRGDAATQTGSAHVAPASGMSLGDLTVHAKARLARWSNLTAGAALHVTLPTASAGQFTGVDLPTVRALGLITWTPIGRLALSANGGGTLRKSAAYGDEPLQISQGSAFDWGAGASYQVLDRLWATGEVFGEVEGDHDNAMATLHTAPAEALAGVTYQLDSGLAVGAAVGGGLGAGIGAPGIRGVVSLSYAAGGAARSPTPALPLEPARERPHEPTDDGDSDGDGVPDAIDQCPNEPEDRDGFQDQDGCPDPDNDRDGIPDARDKCPLEPETVNGYQDDDGCPDEARPASSTKAAEDTFARGRELLSQGKYAAACPQFEQSQRLDPQFGTEYNLAVCYEKTGRLATAWNIYRDLERRDSNAKRQATSASRAAELADRVPQIKLVLAGRPAGLEVRLDGSRATVLVGIAAPVDLGHHEVVVTAPGFQTWHQTIATTSEGKVVEVVIELVPSVP